MSRTVKNRRKKANRRFQRCHQCGVHENETVYGLCYIAVELNDKPVRFCSGNCVDLWRFHHEIICRDHVYCFANADGVGFAVAVNGDCKPLGVFHCHPPRAIYIASLD